MKAKLTLQTILIAPWFGAVQTAALDVAAEDNVGRSPTGLKEPLKNAFTSLKEKCPGIKLVGFVVGLSADGQRTEGNAFP